MNYVLLNLKELTIYKIDYSVVFGWIENAYKLLI